MTNPKSIPLKNLRRYAICAAREGNFLILEHLYLNGFDIFFDDVLFEVIKKDRLDICKWLHQYAPPSRLRCRCPKFITAAIYTKNVDLFLFLKNKGYRMNADACEAAAVTGNLKILTLLKRNGCPWDSRVYEKAALVKNLPILQYAHKYGCKRGLDTFDYIKYSKDEEIISWAKKHGLDEDIWCVSFFIDLLMA